MSTPADENKFQSQRKRMRAVSDVLDILSRFEDPSDRIAIVSTVDSRAERLVEEQLRSHYRKDGQ